MDATLPCNGCGVPLPADSPGGLCPKCLLQAGMKDPAGRTTDQTMLVTPEWFSPESKNQPAPTYLTGSQILGGYRIIRPLGKGGMGAVYEAEEIESGRRVALKVLSQSLDSTEARRRFFREGRVAASVNHPNTVYVFGTDEIDGQPVIVMELVSGGTLQDRVKHKEPMAVAGAVDAILQVIAGLEGAAALGVLHRDIKPSNCFVDTDGTVKVGDFGLSFSTAVRGETKLTMTGAFLGTPAFSSPEQLRGDEFTLQGDIYAVGVTLYYLLTGRTPFEGDDMVRMLTTVLERPPESPAKLRPEIPRGLCRAILRCLEKQPAKRFKTYAELRNALLPYSSAAPSPATFSLRILAGWIDSSLIGLVCGAATSLLAKDLPKDWEAISHHKTDETDLFTLLLSWILNLLYYGVPEGLWGASLGKRLCRLRVVGPNRGLPGVPRAMLRAVIVVWLPALPAVLFMLFSFLPNPSTTAFKLMGVSSGFYVILALLFATARRRNGFAAVQDLLTRTRVIRQSAHQARPGLEPEADRPADTRATSQLGPYHVLETLAKSDSGEMLLGFDTRLQRKVWIRKLPAGSAPVALQLRNLARIGRLRWLNGKRSSEECWDAYEAGPGKPLTSLIRQRQSWRRVRFWLLDLAEEINASQKDQSLPGILQLDRVWITTDGRAKLLDFPAPGSDAPPGQPASQAMAEPPTISSPQLFLNQVVVSALEGRQVAAADARPASAAVPLPLHAREFVKVMQTGLSPGLLAEQLKPLMDNLAFVSRARRLGVIAGSSILPLFTGIGIFAGLALAHMWSPQPRASEVNALRDSLRLLSNLESNQDLPGGLDGEGNAYSAKLLGSNTTWNGTPFHFGPANAPDVVAAIGQTISLPAGRFTNLAMLATAVEGNQESQSLVLTYTDHTTSNWTKGFRNWVAPTNHPRESNALTMAYRVGSNGARDNRKFNLYGFDFKLDSNRTVQSLTLPRNASIEILALTLEPPATMVDLSQAFNQANGIVADGSSASVKANKRTREAFEIYIAGRFCQTISNADTWTSTAGAAIPRDQRITAQQLIARRPAPKDNELAQATAEVEPNLKEPDFAGPVAYGNHYSDPVFLLLAVNPFIMFAAVPSILAAMLFRGGLVLRTLGLEVVKKDGSKASRLLLGGRSFIAWFPVLFMGPLAGLLGMLFPISSLSSGERALLTLGYAVLVACLMICASVLPERGLQDKIAGTCLVPRE